MVSRHIVTMANCIVGVSVLAMPFCFKQCGVVLASVMLLLGGTMTRTACYFLLKASTITKRRTYELLAYHTFGQGGKLAVEISIIGFLVGTLIAFLVVMGDLGPEIVSEMFAVPNNPSLRSIIMTGLSLFVALPLGLLRSIDSLGGVTSVTMLFYAFLAFKIFNESMGPLWSGSFLTRINYWRPAGVLQCIPIFSMALSCQTQIFGVYDSLPDPSLHKMNEIIRKAIHACTLFYISVGFLGYIAFCQQNFGGNILLSFGPSWSTQIIKICVVLSIAFSFPLVIFPCRASLHSLIYKRVNLYTHLTDSSNYIPESRLKLLTFGIIAFTLCISLLIPNIELVLGLVGSTTGSVICIIFPAAMFFKVTSKNTTERLLAQFIFCIGVTIMVVTTYATLFAVEQAQVSDTSQFNQPVDNFIVPGFPEKLEPLPAIQDNHNEHKVVLPPQPPDKDNEIIHGSSKELQDKDEAKEKLEKESGLPNEAVGNEELEKDLQEPAALPDQVANVEVAQQLRDQKDVEQQRQGEGLSSAQKSKNDAKNGGIETEHDKKEIEAPSLNQVPEQQTPFKKKEADSPAVVEKQEVVSSVSGNKSMKSSTRLPDDGLKRSEQQLKAEDILIKLKEHEKMQEKLVEEQKRILDQLKQHREEDEHKLERSHDNLKKIVEDAPLVPVLSNQSKQQYARIAKVPVVEVIPPTLNKTKSVVEHGAEVVKEKLDLKKEVKTLNDVKEKDLIVQKAKPIGQLLPVLQLNESNSFKVDKKSNVSHVSVAGVQLSTKAAVQLKDTKHVSADRDI